MFPQKRYSAPDATNLKSRKRLLSPRVLFVDAGMPGSPRGDRCPRIGVECFDWLYSVTVHNWLPAFTGTDVLDLKTSDDQILATYTTGTTSQSTSQRGLGRASSSPLLPPTRSVGFHAMGMENVSDIDDGGSYVGTNNSALAQPGEKQVYKLLATESGTYTINSMADVTNHTINGLF